MSEAETLLADLKAQRDLVINPRRRNGVILVKPYHAEFAGPGAFIGGELDASVIHCYAVGRLSCLPSPRDNGRVKAYLIRRQWTVLLKQIVDNPIARERAQVILNQLEHWFDTKTVALLPDQALAVLVGVTRETVAIARQEARLVL